MHLAPNINLPHLQSFIIAYALGERRVKKTRSTKNDEQCWIRAKNIYF